MKNAKLVLMFFITMLLISFNGYADDVDKEAATLIAPRYQAWQAVDEKSKGCLSCHVETDSQSMHQTEAVALGCVDC
ncbi:MAG: hypothetical protein KAJ63_15285, partial [Methyloprofundus sp.]|nr:hypothetical protein [Methyloprofundus sp.]